MVSLLTWLFTPLPSQFRKNLIMAPCTISFETVCDLLTTHFDDIDSSILAPHATFESLGLDSLGLMEMLVVVQQKLGVTIGELGVDLRSDLTIGEVAAVLDHHANAAQASSAAE